MLVLLYHFSIHSRVNPIDSAWTSIASSGWAGVDLFFVLSGFLITGILLRSKDQPGYFRNFYARRTLRIFPVYYAFLALMFFALPLLGPKYASRVGLALDNQGWLWTYSTNILLALTRDWRDAVPGFNHFWSLAVEEQFYLFWPAVVLVATRKGLAWTCGALLLLAPLLRLLLIGWDSSFLVAYTFTPARMDGFGVGALLALINAPSRPLPRWFRLAFSAAITGLLAIFIFSSTAPETPWIATLGFTFTALISGGLIWQAVSIPEGRFSMLLRNSWLRALGKYSYAIYIFHPSVRRVLLDFVMPHINLPTFMGSKLLEQAAFYLLGIGTSFLAAVISYHVLEKHFLGLKRHFEPAPWTSRSQSAR